MNISRPNQVWCSDITYTPMPQGFLYLVAVMDGFRRCFLSWELSNSLDADFCVDAVSRAIKLHGTSDIFNTDQGAQFTSKAFVGQLLDHNIQVSMDGRARYLDSIFIERLWRTVKYEEIYLKEYHDGKEASSSLGIYFPFYNTERPHSIHDGKTPWEVFSCLF
jgi:putative transposase